MQNGHTVADSNNAITENLIAPDTHGEVNGAVNGHDGEPSSDRPAAAQNGGPDATVSSAPATPRGQKRKLLDASGGRSSRGPSPPWRRIEAEGPTTIIENGRRKSGRVNAVPLDMQPQGPKRHTRDAQKKYETTRRRGSGPAPAGRGMAAASTRGRGGSMRGRGRTFGRGGAVHAQQSPRRGGARSVPPRPMKETPQPTRRSARASLGGQDVTPQVPATNGVAPGPRLAKGYVNFIPGPVPIFHPGNILRPPKYASLREYLSHDDPFDDGEGERRLTEAEARREAFKIQRVLDARAPGRPFADGSRLMIESQTQDEPTPNPPHAHIDHVVNHALELRRLMLMEQTNHMKQARALAHAVAAKVKSMQPETEEERSAKQLKESRQRYKVLQKELEQRFKYFENVVTTEKHQQHQQSEAAKAKALLDDRLRNATSLLQGRVGSRLLPSGEGRRGSSMGTDRFGSQARDSIGLTDGTPTEEEDAGTHSDDDDSDDSLDDDSDADSDDSDSDSGDEGEDGAVNSDDELDEEQLRAKYGNLEPLDDQQQKQQLDGSEEVDLDSDMANGVEEGQREDEQALPELEEVDQALLDDSDADSSSGTEESSSASDSDGDEDDGASELDEAGNSLWGFFSKSEIQKFEKSEDDKTETAQEVPDAPLPDAEEPAMEDSTSSPKPDEAVETKEEVEQIGQDLSGTVEARVATPSLLRGTLRPYQQEGLDWLARMYANDTNGILADEMGLGKTIQSISLLAHLATYHQVWGPHLVVVPTSVLLNWEVEFKKFAPGFKVLSYYGTQEERKMKRKGWMDNDKWHVCITSYQLAVQDAVSLKKRDWHYIILDEAHNIKNFRSQRWQTLLNFKSRARLLLTGTPLQNNLTELWSLLFFLAPEEDEQGRSQFGELAEFAKQFHRPVEAILDRGQTELDVESRGIVGKLHTILRPHLLRRIKSEVEKQMPKKYEHITVCRLSKRQRQLYDEFMGRADTRESFASRNYMSIISCLMALRKVCNHPDLFETRSINTSYAMSRSAVADFEIKELLVRRRMLAEEKRDTSYRLLNLWRPNVASYNALTTRRLAAIERLADSTGRQRRRLDMDRPYDGRTVESAMAGIDHYKRLDRHTQLAIQYAHTVVRSWQQPSLALNTLERVTIPLKCSLSNPTIRRSRLTEAHLDTSSALQQAIVPLADRAEQMQPYMQRFACVTPRVVCEDVTRLTLTAKGMDTIEDARELAPDDNFHEARMRLSIAFPDKTLIQYDCGKLQQLAKLLRQLQAGGHRALIFTQMTKVLDVLEQFLNLHGYRYMRLDGTTKIERRQVMTDRFNADPTFLCFILSTRSGGLGINLTGADTVIFYDNDWNPAMDKQCQDRCHRIGQTRDVHIYRFVCEGTIEMNILRKSNQKRELDKFIIQEGDFTTDFLSRMGEGDDEADDAIDQVLGGGQKEALTKVEDKDDIDAARVAEKEYVHTDDADFDERQAEQNSNATPGEGAAPAGAGAAGAGAGPADPKQGTPQLGSSTAEPGTPAVQGEEKISVVALEAFEVEEEDGSKVTAPGLDRNIRTLDGWFFEHWRRELKNIRFETAEEQRRRVAKNKKRKSQVPLIRR